MIKALRKAYNAAFTKENYEDFLKDLHSVHPGAIEFRVAETPVFVPADFKEKIMDACESIVDIIVDPGFKKLTEKAIPANITVPNENAHSHFIAFDFGICINEAGEYEPQLIEMQGFPTLFAYEVLLEDTFRKHFSVPPHFDCYLGGYNRDSYIRFLKEIIVGEYDPSEVVLLEIFPEKQKTRIDFYCTQDYLGIQPVCITDLIEDGKQLFYLKDGKTSFGHRNRNQFRLQSELRLLP
jgi:hypothetical protein